jgi:hypothetical protein
MGTLDNYKAEFGEILPEKWTRDEWNRVVAEMQITPETMLTIGEAALFVGCKHGLSDNAIRRLCHQMMKAEGRGLTVRDKFTNLPYAPSDGARWFYELVRADELDSWFISCKVPYRIQPPTISQSASAANVKAAQVITTSSEDKPWLIANEKDPTPDYPWYTPARYFARQLVKNDSTLLTKKNLLAGKVSSSLANVGILKRGEKLPLADTTILKAFVNVRWN